MAERANDLYLVSHLQIAHVVAGHAAHGFTFVVFEHALHGECGVVVAGPLAVASTGNGVLARYVRLAVGIYSGWDDADGLAFEHWERHGPKVQNDVMGLVFEARFGAVQITYHRCRHRVLGAVQIGVRVRC